MNLQEILKTALELKDESIRPTTGTLNALLENCLTPTKNRDECKETDNIKVCWRQFRVPKIFSKKYTEERVAYEIIRSAREISIELNNNYSKTIYDLSYGVQFPTFDGLGVQIADWDKQIEGILIMGVKGQYLKPTHEKYKLYVDLYMDGAISNQNENILSFKASEFYLTPIVWGELDLPFKKHIQIKYKNIDYTISAIYNDDTEMWTITVASRYEFTKG